MPFVSNLGTNPLARQENAPLPYDDVLDTTPIVFQKWHERDDSTNKWAPLPPLSDYTAYTPPFQPSATESRPQTSSDLTLVTWNIDASSPSPEARIAALASLILSKPVDVILLQEVSKAALAWLLDNAAIRQGWLVSDADTSSWEGHPFGSLTLVSKTRFAEPDTRVSGIRRVRVPSVFGRDSLLCNIFLPKPGQPGESIRVMLANAHLDSLPCIPCLRPKQLKSVAVYLGLGVAKMCVLAGQFIPVQPEGDDGLFEDNRLVDVCTEVKGDEPGFTWGWDAMQMSPPRRMDKATMLGLEIKGIKILSPGRVTREGGGGMGPGQTGGHVEGIPWSDHSGLMCTLHVTYA